MSGDHEADPKFVEFLEWQLASEQRRAVSLPAPAPTPKRKGIHMITTIALVAVSTLVGATGAISVVQQVDEAQKELLVMKGEILLEQATVQLERHVEELEHAQPLAEQGFIGRSEIEQLRQGIRQAEAEIARRELNLDETRRTGRPPRDDLAAPQVDGRDYVSERLRTELKVVRSEIERRHVVFEQTRALAERGFITTAELESDRKSVEETERQLQVVERRLDLRRRFLAGELSAPEVELQDMAFAATAEFENAQITLDVSARLHDRVADRFEAAAISRSELREAEANVRAAEARLRLAEIELRIIRRQIERIESRGGT